MNRFDGTAARQLLLVDERDTPIRWGEAPRKAQPSLRLLQRDVYVELAKRRRRAQINARRLVDSDE